MPRNQYISIAVIRRLPRYYRFLKELINNDVIRISSKDLAEMMNVTASQIRQDLNCFGGFGQQGYGYNVLLLFNEISKILGLDQNFNAILLGAGNLGRAFATHIDFKSSGFKLQAIFDNNPDVVGKSISNITVLSIEQLEEFCKNNVVDIAILCVPNEAAALMAERLIACGITAFWNFTHQDIALGHPDLIVENAHLVDGLMTLCYQINDAKNC